MRRHVWLGAAAAWTAAPPSRQLCNLAFGLWATAQIVLALCICLLGSACWPHAPAPLLGAINRQLLPTFLAANVATGAVNGAMHVLGTPTMQLSELAALGTLGAYLTLVGAFALWREYGPRADHQLSRAGGQHRR